MSDSRDKPSTTDETGARPGVPQVWKPAPAGGDAAPEKPREIGGREGPEPVRYGDWEKNGRCIDF